MLKTDDFKNDPSWIAKRLGITDQSVKAALEKLKVLNLVKETTNGKLIRTHQKITTTDDKSDSFILDYQLQTLGLALQSIKKTPTTHRDITTLTVATSPEKLNEAKALMRQFQKQLDILLFSAKNKTEVYTFTMALFPLTGNN